MVIAFTFELFDSVFINDLAQQIKDSKIGVELSLNEVGAAISLILSILLYADDVVATLGPS